MSEPGAAMGFLALLPATRTRNGRPRSVVLAAGPRKLRFDVSARLVPAASLLQAVAGEAGPSFAALPDMLVETFMAKPGQPNLGALTLEVLAAAAQPDGVIEVMGQLDTGEVYVQGWSRSMGEASQAMFACGGHLVPTQLCSATMPRDDLGGSARGFCALFDADALPHDAIRMLIWRGPGGWLSLPLYDGMHRLSALEVPPHIRSLLKAIKGSAEALDRLEKGSRRFDGRDTINAQTDPVRLGIDMTLEAPGAGLFVTGWLLDPAHAVAAVKLRSPGHMSVLSSDWIKTSRPDVSRAYASDPALELLIDPDRHDHGFIAFVPDAKARDGGAYLEIEFDNGASAFQRLPKARPFARRELDRILAHLGSGSGAALAVDRLLGPMLKTYEPNPIAVTHMADYGFDASAPTALVLAAGRDAADLCTSLALLALDPEARELPILVSIPTVAFTDLAGEVARLAMFYRLRVRLLASEGVADACDALQAAAGHTDAETFIVVASGVFPVSPGWIGRLERAFRTRGGRALISPTVLFEDESVQFAGLVIEDDGRERRIVERHAGFPRASVAGAGGGDVLAGTVACCIVPRRAIVEHGLLNRGYLGATHKFRDLCLRLRLAGTPSVWLPGVEMIAADDAGQASALPDRLDRRTFDGRWSLALANLNA